MLAQATDLDGRFALDGAGMFANTAANAEFVDDVRSAFFDDLSVAQRHFRFSNFDGFFRNWAVFLAHETPDAAIVIEMGVPNAGFALGRNFELGNGSSRANLAAKIAIVLTVADARN